MFMHLFDPTMLLVLAGAALCMWASANVKNTFNKYSRVPNHQGITGEQTARKILDDAGLRDVQVRHVQGNLTDHYDPRSRTVNLSDATFGATSVAAMGVAAHECGHAIQHQTHYTPLAIRGNLVPIANFGSMVAWPLILAGLFINSASSNWLINLGIIAFSAAVLFQIVTLPVEINASDRALKILGNSGMVSPDEMDDAIKVLKAAALTYIAGAAAAILQLVRILMIVGGRRSRD